MLEVRMKQNACLDMSYCRLCQYFRSILAAYVRFGLRQSNSLAVNGIRSTQPGAVAALKENPWVPSTLKSQRQSVKLVIMLDNH